MKLERHPGPVRDPFMAAVRRRHADVDIVLLPPEPGRPGSAADVDGGPPPGDTAARDPRVAAAELLASVANTADRLWGHAGDDPAVVLRTREDGLVAGPAAGSVAGRARIVADSTDGDAVLSRLAIALREEGWRVQRTDGAVRRLSAAGAGLTLRSTHAPSSGGLMLEVLSEAVDVGPSEARLLLEGAR